MKIILKILASLVGCLLLVAVALAATDTFHERQCRLSPEVGTVVTIPGETITVLSLPTGEGAPLVIDVVREPFKIPDYELQAEHGHIHRHQEESFEILQGRAGFLIGDQRLEAGPGEVVVGPPNTLHHWMALGGEAVRAKVTFSPGDDVAEFFKYFHAHVAEGPVDFFQAAVIAREYPEGTPLPAAPHPLAWDIALRVLAPIGRLLGYSAC